MAVVAASPAASCWRRVRPLHLECWTRRRSSADHRIDPDVARPGAGPCSAAYQGEAAAEVADPEKHAPKDATRAGQSRAGCLDSYTVCANRCLSAGSGATEEGQDPSAQSPSKGAGPTPAKGARSQVDAPTGAWGVRQFPQPGRLEVNQLIRRQLLRAHP